MPADQRILIANRGEIACRIARTAHRMGLTTIGVYSEPDRASVHADAVDIAVALGGATPSATYLRGDLLIEVAVDHGASHLHPGYGFLAENADFAEQVIEAGIVWVGPSPDQIRLLGDKVAAKRAAVEAGVPTTAFIEVHGAEPPAGVQFPALVKAAAGGGGRGMRVVHDAAELADAIASASREAESAFGDASVFIEPFIEHGRHVEVQILGDQHGNVVHLGTRECSIQRRNQKVIEEAPSVGISEAVREQLHDGAVALARQVGYQGAGTVEFMVGADDTVTFLEVNTRLQVEHPVTEAITGFDLVEAQIAIADGQPLRFDQQDVVFDGHAIEARLVAEDPAVGWLPSTGTLAEFGIDGDVRIDTGFRAESVVSSDYDSLLAKVIAHAPTRDVAAARLGRSLRRARIAGVRTNAAMLAATMSESDFLAARTYTSYLDEHADVVAAAGPDGDDRLALLLGVVFAEEQRARAGDEVARFAPSGWRNLRTRGQRRTWLLGGEVEYHVEYVFAGARHAADDRRGVGEGATGDPGSDPDVLAEVWVGPWPDPLEDGSLPPDERRRVHCRLLRRSPDQQVVEVDGRRTVVTVRFHGATVLSSSAAGALEWLRAPTFIDHDAALAGGGPICPLPGTVIAVHVEPGDVVVEGQLLMVVEAMKMEHKIVAAGAATIVDVKFATGDRVDGGDLLVALDAHQPADDAEPDAKSDAGSVPSREPGS